MIIKKAIKTTKRHPKDKYPKLSNLMAVLSASIAIFLLFVTYDNFRRGGPYLFVTFTGLLTAILGVTNALCRFKFKHWFHFFGDWFSLTGLFLIISYWTVYRHGVLQFVLISFGAFWLANLVFSRVNRPRRKFAFLKSAKLNLHQLLLILMVIIGIWFVPFESNFNMVQTPNRGGAQTYSSRDYSLEISGGFLQRINLAAPNQKEEIVIKQLAPNTTISFNSQKAIDLKINILNTRPNYQFNFNNQPISIQAYEPGQVFTKALAAGQSINEDNVYSKEYTGSRKGYWADIKLNSGKTDFVIAPPKTDNNQLEFFVVSDLHSGYGVNFAKLQEIILANPDFIVANGDIVNYGIRSEYVVAGGLFELSPVPIFTTIGNHEAWQSGLRYYKDYFGPLKNSFTYKDCLFVFVDSHSGYIGQIQFDWLKLTLAGSSAKHKLVFSHMPPINPKTGEFDSGDYHFEELRSSLFDKSESDELLKILNDYKVDALIAGHTHSQAQTAINGTNIITTGALGGAVGNGEDVSYLKVVIGDSIEYQPVSVATTQQIAQNKFTNLMNTLRLFAGPFLLDKAIRLNLTIILLIFADYLVRRRYLNRALS